MGIQQYGEAYNFIYDTLGTTAEWLRPILRTTRVWVTKKGNLIVISPDAEWYDFLTGQKLSVLKANPDTVFPQRNNPRAIQTNPEYWEKKPKPTNYYVGTV